MSQTSVLTRADMTLAVRFSRMRAQTIALCHSLQPEDMVVQSSDEASPIKWHLAHTTWFFEQFLLRRDPGYVPFRDGWSFLFNSYYQSVGPMHARSKRGLLTRPSVAEVMEYRRTIDRRMQDFLAIDQAPDVQALVELGINHEQQHQELILMDAKVMLWSQPLQPAYRNKPALAPSPLTAPLRFVKGQEGVAVIGADDGFSFDNELPRHKTYLSKHALGSRLVTNGEFSEFVRDGGYSRPGLWLSEGWDTVVAKGWKRPLYWNEGDDAEFTLFGWDELDKDLPVSHVSFYEADAYARWANARLPTEFEWETAANGLANGRGNFLESGLLRPSVARASDEGPSQMVGDLWEWTSSPYVSYPGFRATEGAVGEYNGKFMSSQWVLRGGSYATPASHFRASYRNFFYPRDRWQFSGLRLAVDV